MLRTQQPRRRRLGRVGVSRHAGRQPGRTRCDDRQGEVGGQSGRRPRRRIHRNDGSAGDRRQRDHRDLGRRVRHPGLREGVQRGERRAGLDLVHTPDPQHGGWWGKWSKTTGEGDDLKRDIAKEKADSAKYADAWKTGGGSMWMTPAYDDATKTLFVAIGNPSPDLDGGIRPGDHLWTESIVAINATNGEFKWGYQEVPHDVWDLDAVSPPVIAMVGGKKAVVEAGKTGFVYVLRSEERRVGKESRSRWSP